jgi:RNA polymerase sigma-54 factor
MKQSLQIRLGQQITMTPQLQQAIRLLQLSSLELQMEIQQVLDSNIMLEVADDHETENEDKTSTDVDELNNYSEENDDTGFEAVSDIPSELSIDTQWEDVYDGAVSSYEMPNHNDSNDKDFLFNQESAAQTLHDHLSWQLDLTPFSDLDRAIATAIIDAINEDGFLCSSLEDIKESLGETDEDEDEDEDEVEIEEIEAVLHRVQQFDPIGIGARDIKECLLLQLNALDINTPWLKEAKQLITEHLNLLGAHDYAQLTKRMKLNREKLREVVDLIQSLKPRPGAEIETPKTTYIIPDVFVKKVNGQWKVELNSEIAPKIRVNPYYSSLVSKTNKSADNNNLKSHLQEARWFIKSLKSRHETLLKVATCIVKRQVGFLEYGEEAMKPLVLHDIAQELSMHESTISRVTTQKYLHTHRGIFELKYFFSSHVNTSNGGECSSTAIRAMIKKLIAAEVPTKPLSDSKIATLLSERGIKVARRTVAKYREAMVIPPSNERKRLA